MRKLNERQKGLLDQWLKTNSHLPGLAVCDATLLSEFTYGLWCDLQKANDFETLHQHVNHYINDNAMKYNKNANPHFNNHLGL